MKHKPDHPADAAAINAQHADAAPVPRGPTNDSTASTQAEALIASEQRYRRLFEAARDGILILDADTGAVVDVNPFLVELLGFSRETFIGKTLWDLGFLRDIIANQDSFAELKEEKYVRYDDKPLRTTDGRRVDVEFVSNVYRAGGRDVIQCNIRDIIARKRSAEVLRANELLLSEAQRLGHVGSWLWEMTGPFKWSDETYRIYGVEPDTFTPTPETVLSLIHPDDRPAMESWFSAFTLGEKHELEFRLNGSDGAGRVLLGRGEAVAGIGNNRAYMAGTVQDVTERKRAEEEKAALEAQLRQAQKMEAVGRLAGGVAHDFNNMLGVILGHAELALEDLDPAQPLYTDLLAIRSAARRSADLTRQLLAFARKQIIVPTVLDVNESVEHMLEMLRRLIGENIALVWRPGTHPWRVKMDPSQIDQILVNLCLNARDAIAGAGTVTIESENTTLDHACLARHPGAVPGEYVRLAVSDDGCGMDHDTQAQLFEPFFTTKAMGEGTGLGLSSVYGIVEQNHGFIEVFSKPGVGATFTIYLPRHPNTGESVGTQRASDPAGRGHETILVVEDEPAVLKMTTRMLVAQGYTVLAARSPAEAIRLAGESAAEIQLVMTDVIMPGMNGADLAAHLRSLSPHLKWLFTSGYTADVIVRHGVLEDGVHFLQKPFSVRALAANVREALDRP
jgi:PAS domain S-box-containing protein